MNSMEGAIGKKTMECLPMLGVAMWPDMDENIARSVEPVEDHEWVLTDGKLRGFIGGSASQCESLF